MRENPLGAVIGALICAVAITACVASPVLLAPRHALAAPMRVAAPAADESSVTTPVPLPLQMADVKDAQQLLVATAPHLGDTTGTLQVFDLVDGVWVTRLTISARFGTHGLMDGIRRTEGNRTTPTGIWRMPGFVFGTHAHAPKGTHMHFRRLTRNTWWSSRRGATYNIWVRARHWTGEHIGYSPRAYEFAVSVGYNARPNTSVYGRGTGIFLHVRGKGLTAGCVAVSRTNMIRICRLLDRGKRPYFAIGTLEAGAPTSIWAY